MLSALVISEKNNPSDYYHVVPFLEKQGYHITRFFYAEQEQLDFLNYDIVVVSRYFPEKIKRLFSDFKKNNIKVVFFMDDDLWDVAALSGLPWRYKYKIWRLVLSNKKFIQTFFDEFWFSSDFLVKKYNGLNPVKINGVEQCKPHPESFSFFYHGTASHWSEIKWLLPIIYKIQRSYTYSFFEIFGDKSVRKLYQKVPRKLIVHPTDWESYFSYSLLNKHHVGLAPLLPTPFNQARTITKFFDFTRMGAVGIYSNVVPYKDFIRHGVDGMLLENDEKLWIDAIEFLMKNPDLRCSMLKNAQERVKELT